MSTKEFTPNGWLAAIFLALAAFVYLGNTGSQHAATNPDEYLYLQIARLTAATGHSLPLQSTEIRHRNTKPPGLFWQAIASTDHGRHWDLWRLRLPNALFSVATAAMAFLIARKLHGTFSAGTAAALAYLAFLGVYRHGRVFLTSAPETFWLFLPFFVLLMRPSARIGWGTALSFGLILGVGLLYKSFVMIIPTAGALAWWALHERGYRTRDWIARDAPKIILITTAALAVFGLWFLLDPQRHFIWQDFVLKENAGKFDAEDSSYLAIALWGKHSIWSYTAGWLVNAGLMTPVVIAVFVFSWRDRRKLSAQEQLLWIWIITLFAFHLLPNLRYERYLLPAMPAIAVLCGLYWERIPRWLYVIILAASAAGALVLLGGALLLARHLPGIDAYSPGHWAWLVGIFVFAAAGIARANWSRAFALPSIILVYLGFSIFLRPFDGPLGTFTADAMDAPRGRTVILPSPFMARDDLYRFFLNGANMRRINSNALDAALADDSHQIFIIPTRLDAPAEVPGFHTLGRRLMLRDYFSAKESADMLRGNIAPHLFGWDLLVERTNSASH